MIFSFSLKNELLIDANHTKENLRNSSDQVKELLKIYLLITCTQATINIIAHIVIAVYKVIFSNMSQNLKNQFFSTSFTILFTSYLNNLPFIIISIP